MLYHLDIVSQILERVIGLALWLLPTDLHEHSSLRLETCH
jgi:hypothetical protein